ncbi:MAG: hypothetical protein H6779_02225 [Candidatus Nomurabacteria bacterium]|nr:hypothetical protein [Candidatus Nomurabacteria bacterium]USN88241.1 MAG: hypothetical protein H6779_02225 [Candidatus Nomurabacteria bacterium]
MILKKFIAGLLMIPLLLAAGVPATAVANTTLVEQERQLQLLLQIEQLLNVVLSLQKKLEALESLEVQETEVVSNREIEVVTNRQPYKSKFYDFPYEAIYFVEDGRLLYADGTRSSRSIDKRLFELLVDVVGPEIVDRKIREWRIFDRSHGDLGGYVELMATTKNGPRDWIMGVNIDGYDSSKQSTKSYSNLFIHEYSHLLLYDYSRLTDQFKANFWTRQDYAHVDLIKEAKASEIYYLNKDYFDDNENRFVSEYSVNAPEEDMAETFVYFVREGKPANTTIRNQKILFYYDVPEFVQIRAKIRENLKDLGVL